MLLHPTQTTVTMLSDVQTPTSASPRSRKPEMQLFTTEIFLMLVSALWLIVSRVLGVEVRLVDGACLFTLVGLWLRRRQQPRVYLENKSTKGFDFVRSEEMWRVVL